MLVPNYDHNTILATGFHMIATVAWIAMTKVQPSERFIGAEMIMENRLWSRT